MADLRTHEVNDLLYVLAKTSEPDDIYKVLQDVFTIREIRETSQRLGVARLLRQGKPYTSIEQATGASATTIARVSKCLSYGSGGYEAALALLEERDYAGDPDSAGDADYAGDPD